MSRLFNKAYRFFSIDFQKLKESRQSRSFAIDLFMLFLVVINLLCIAFDYSFQFSWVQLFWKQTWQAFFQLYKNEIHPNAVYYDLGFVSVFVLELLIRWGISIYKKTYYRWFYYPFIHWYDVLGCIPFNSTFRLLRFLRLFSMFYRLQRLGVIDVTKTYIYKTADKYRDIVVEEITDRVVIRVLDGIQEELQQGTPMAEKIAREVLMPKSEIITIWLSERISDAITLTYADHKIELRLYVEELVSRAVKDNKEIANIKLIPGVGKIIANTLDSAISDITFNVVDNMMDDLGNARQKRGVSEITDAVINSLLSSREGEGKSVSIVIEVVNDSIEIVKNEVKLKQWKIKEEKADSVRKEAKEALTESLINGQ